jgi:hypothetical protein
MASEAEGAGVMLEQGAIMLGAALAFVTVYRRFGIGAVLGYLTAGMLLGPWVLNVVPDPGAMFGIADLGIACCCSWLEWSFTRAGCGGLSATFSGSASRRSSLAE